MKAVFLDTASIHPDDLDLSALQKSCEDWRWLDNVEAGTVLDAIGDAEIVITNKVELDEAVIAEAPALKLICAAATGVNNIDIDAAARRGVVVSNARSYATPSVVQHVFTLLLSLVTNVGRYQHDVTSGQWSKSEFFCLLDHPVRELSGMTMGIVGYGELGQAVAKVAGCFGMQVLIAKRGDDDTRRGRISLQELLPQVDVLSLHCPLTETTRGLISALQISFMKDDAIIINTARGGLIDEQALLSALRAGTLGGAGLDVLALEPPPSDSELLQDKPPNLIITPHTAWASREARQRLVGELVANITAFRQGESRNRVVS